MQRTCLYSRGGNVHSLVGSHPNSLPANSCENVARIIKYCGEGNKTMLQSYCLNNRCRQVETTRQTRAACKCKFGITFAVWALLFVLSRRFRCALSFALVGRGQAFFFLRSRLVSRLLLSRVFLRWRDWRSYRVCLHLRLLVHGVDRVQRWYWQVDMVWRVYRRVYIVERDRNIHLMWI